MSVLRHLIKSFITIFSFSFTFSCDYREKKLSLQSHICTKQLLKFYILTMGARFVNKVAEVEQGGPGGQVLNKPLEKNRIITIG